VAAADAGQEGAGGVGADARQFHQAFAARILAGRVANDPVVLGNPDVELSAWARRSPTHWIGVTRQIFQVVANERPAQAGDLLRQTMPNFRDQAAQPVVGGRAFFDKAGAGCGAA
jgi:hypothetical protein